MLKFVIFLQIGDFCQIGLIGQIGQIDDLMSILVKFMIQYSTEIIYIMNMMKYRYNEIKWIEIISLRFHCGFIAVSCAGWTELDLMKSSTVN